MNRTPPPREVTVKSYPVVDDLLHPGMQLGTTRTPRLHVIGCREGDLRNGVGPSWGDGRLQSRGAAPGKFSREAKRGLDGNHEGGHVGLLPGPGGTALKIQERVSDDLSSPRVQMGEDPRLHLAGNRILWVTDGHIQDVALLIVAVNQGLCHSDESRTLHPPYPGDRMEM